MHLFNILSGRWDGMKSNLVSIRSILLTWEAECEKEYNKKEKSPLFFNLIYYWLSS